MKISTDVVVGLRYVITDRNGAIVEKTPDKRPWYYLHGAEECPPGLEEALLGHTVGTKMKVSLGPEKAFGPKKEASVIQIPRTELPSSPSPEVGMLLTVSQGPNETDFRIVEVQDDNITLDANHPLAGQTIEFDVEVIEVRPPTAAELLNRSANQPNEATDDNNVT